MDDVWIIIALILFGSLLFCLCCYKVSNLLYMLYHIDDSDSLAAVESSTVEAALSTANAALAVGAPLPAAVISPSFKTDLEPSQYTNHSSSVDIVSQSINQHPNQQPQQQQQSSTSMQNLLPLTSPTSTLPNSTSKDLLSGIRKANSVMSLSVGIQCNPKDVDKDCQHQDEDDEVEDEDDDDDDDDVDGADQVSYSQHLSSSAIFDPIRSQLAQSPAKNADFRHESSPDLTQRHHFHQLHQHHHGHGHHRHQQLHHYHHTHSHKAYSQSPFYNSIHSASLSRDHSLRYDKSSDYLLAAAAAAAAAAASCQRHSKKGQTDYQMSSDAVRYRKDGLRLVTRGHTCGLSQLSDSDPDVRGSGAALWPAASASQGGSSVIPRRYGSIRVAECSFIEQPDSRISTPSPAAPSSSACDVATSGWLQRSGVRLSSSGSDSTSRQGYLNSVKHYSEVSIPTPRRSDGSRASKQHQHLSSGHRHRHTNGPSVMPLTQDRRKAPVKELDIIPPPQDFGSGSLSRSSMQQLLTSSTDRRICTISNPILSSLSRRSHQGLC